MILTEDLLNALDNERIENNIDREDIIRIVTTYALQSKVSSIEFTLIRSFINKLTKLSDDPEENKKRDAKKAEISKKNGIKLIYINYWEDVTVDLIKEKIEEYNLLKEVPVENLKLSRKLFIAYKQNKKFTQNELNFINLLKYTK